LARESEGVWNRFPVAEPCPLMGIRIVPIPEPLVPTREKGDQSKSLSLYGKETEDQGCTDAPSVGFPERGVLTRVGFFVYGDSPYY